MANAMWAVGKREIGIILVMSCVAILTGPFGTFNELSLATRAVYWGVAIIGISLIIIASVHVIVPRIFPALQPVQSFLLGAVLGGAVAALWLMAIDVVVRDETFDTSNHLHRWFFISVITAGVGLGKGYIRWHAFEALFKDFRVETMGAGRAPLVPETPPLPDTPPPSFLRHLEPDLRGDLISISTQDHYLDVVTDQGRDRILKRLSDALVELDGFPGLQVHRSHWVALDAVERLEKDGRKAWVVLKNGDTLPVSRPNLPILAEALAQR